MATYVITGADRDTGRSIKMRVNAATPDEARASCNDDGILVSSVVDSDIELEVARAPARAAQTEYAAIIASVQHKALVRAVTLGVVRGLFLFVILMAIIAFVCFVVNAVLRGLVGH